MAKRRADLRRAAAELREAQRLLEKARAGAPPPKSGRTWVDVAYKVAERLPREDLYYVVLAIVFGWFLLIKTPEVLTAIVGPRAHPLVAPALQALAMLLYALLVVILMRLRRR